MRKFNSWLSNGECQYIFLKHCLFSNLNTALKMIAHLPTNYSLSTLRHSWTHVPRDVSAIFYVPPIVLLLRVFLRRFLLSTQYFYILLVASRPTSSGGLRFILGTSGSFSYPLTNSRISVTERHPSGITNHAFNHEISSTRAITQFYVGEFRCINSNLVAFIRSWRNGTYTRATKGENVSWRRKGKCERARERMGRGKSERAAAEEYDEDE